MTEAEPKNLVEMFLERVGRLGDRPALRFKRDGAWREITWREWEREVKLLAFGLLKLGLKHGDTVSIASNNRPEWVHFDLAVQMAGGILVSVYPSLTPEEVRFIHDDARVRFAVVEDASQLAKLLSVIDSLPQVGGIVLVDGRSDDPRVMSYADFRETGAGGNDAVLEKKIEAIGPGDVATIIYTSGTTGLPKGVMLTHDNVLFNCEAVLKVFEVRPDDSAISYLPLSHAYERVGGFYVAVYAGIVMNFAESLDRMSANLLEVRPTLLCAVPRVIEKAYAAIQAKVASGGVVSRALFGWAVAVGRQTSASRLEGRPLPPMLSLKHRLARRLVYSRIAERFGGRLRFIAVAGAPMSKSIAEFFHALDLLVLEGWGMTECAAPATLNTLQKARFGTVGLPLPGVELKIAEDGEILMKGRSVFAGYFRNPEATAETIRDGWLHTGDIGEIDPDGMLRITDRKKDLIITSGGKNIAPQKIENLLIADPYIAQAVVIGDERHFLTALISPSMDAVARFAKEKGLGPAAGERATAATHPQVIAFIRERVELANRQLAKFETIKEFRLLPCELTQETGELTPTLKLKRKVVKEKYKDLIEQMYGGPP
ncbi:MAG: long-chain fatty acid--CoA ligase [Deltaproteobacteria bacterium]|nr:long-chain fatty acid--CoA ligase [Deltaproteobacteria bacterium]